MNAHTHTHPTPFLYELNAYSVHFFCSHKMIPQMLNACHIQPSSHKKRQTTSTSESEQKNIVKTKNINRKYNTRIHTPQASNDSKNAIRLVASCERAERTQLYSDNDTVAKSSSEEKQKFALRGAFSYACALCGCLKQKPVWLTGIFGVANG